MKDILQTIVENKRKEVAAQKEAVKLQNLLKLGNDGLERQTRSMRSSLIDAPVGIISEFKRRSPSKGNICPDAKVEDIIPLYEQNGAAACSILTDSRFFGGSFSDFSRARRLTDLPLLRKDFIIDTYQLYQSKIMGADAILLIASCLTKEECREFSELAHTLEMEVLLEVHSAEELSYLNPHIDMLGVNNRNLGTFQTDLENSHHLIDSIREKMNQSRLTPLLISESGIHSAQDVMRLEEEGFEGFLIGEMLMTNPDPAATLRTLIHRES